jgi:hypothetical protein
MVLSMTVRILSSRQAAAADTLADVGRHMQTGCIQDGKAH